MRKILDYLIIVFCFFIIAGLAVWGYQLSQFKAHVQYLELTDAKIAYYIRGEGKPLILLEGFGMTMEDWDPALLSKLSESHKLIIFDFRGVGLSQGKIDGLKIEQMTDDTIQLLSRLNIKKTDIIGWSMGSLIAQEISADHPDLVNKMVLASTFPADKNNVDGSNEVGDLVQKNLDHDLSSFLISTMFPSSPSGRQAMKLYLKRREEALKKGEAPQIPNENLKVKIAQEEAMGQLSGLDRSKKLSTITVPTLVMAGEDDILLPVANDKFVAKTIPHAKLVIYKDSAHAFLFGNDPNVFKEIQGFLQ